MKKNTTLRNSAIIILIFLFNSIGGNAQTENEQKTYKNESYVTVNLLSSLNGFNPRWRVGYIQGINEIWRIGLDFGYGNRDLSFSDFGDKIGDDYRLWEIRPEIYYIINPKKKAKHYFSVELFYINHKDVFFYDYFFTEAGAFSFDRANYKRQKYGFNLKYGLFSYSKKRIILNIYTGLGVRLRNNEYSEFINLNEKSDSFRDSMLHIESYKETEGNSFGVNFSYGFKLCYRLTN